VVASAARHRELEGATPTVIGMRVEQLWRYPVKSMQGERLLEATLSETGQRHDREYGVIDRRTGRVLTGKTVPQLMFGRARLDGDTVVVALPGGSDLDADDPAGAVALSAWLDRDVFLERAGNAPRAFQVQQVVADSEPSPTAAVRDVWCPAGTFLDSAPVHLVDVDWLRGADVRRFRPTVLLHGISRNTSEISNTGEIGNISDQPPADEHGWIGSTVRIGSATLRIAKPTKRCAIVQRPQPGLARDVPLARTLISEHGNVLGVYATVEAPGRIALADVVRPA
jgi:uncharacterized protein YcbX